MASNRINRINEEIMKELSSLLRTVKDPRVQDTMISITRVETTPDLRYTKVYVSFLQRENAKQALTGLKSAGGYLRLPGGKKNRRPAAGRPCSAAALCPGNCLGGGRQHRVRRKNAEAHQLSGGKP